MSYLIWLYTDYGRTLTPYTAVVDDTDADLGDDRWNLWEHANQRYARRRRGLRIVTLHRVILARMLGRELAAGEEVDHRNGFGLDNVRANLRLATRTENARNLALARNNTSGATGVLWDKHANKWRACIRVDGRLIHLGYFTDFNAAVAVRREAELRYFGEFSPILSRQDAS